MRLRTSYFAPLGLALFATCPHALRRGLHSFAASRLRTLGLSPPCGYEPLALFRLECAIRLLKSSASPSVLWQLRDFLHYGVGIAFVLGDFGRQGLDVSEADACFLQHGVAQHFY